MAINYTTLLGLAQPVNGTESGTWGTVVNDSVTQLVEDAIAATATQSVAGGNWTLTTTGSGAANQARCAIIRPTGSPGVSRDIIAPGQSKAYIVDNQSDAAVVFKASATTGVTIAAGKQALVAWNGSDFVQVGASAGGANTQVQFNNNGALGGSANLTFDGTTLTAANFADSSLTSGRVTYAGASGNLTDSANLAFDGSNLTIGGQGDLRLADSAGGEYIALQAPTTVASNVTLTLPGTAGSNGQLLTTDGAGVLSWSTVSSPAQGGGALIVNTTNATVSYVLPVGSNAFSVGPITVDPGVTITVSAGQRWVVI